MYTIRNIILTATLPAVILALSAGCCQAQQTFLETQSFETASGTVPPAGWGIELITGTLPGISFVTAATQPPISSAGDGTLFALFSSSDPASGSTRLKQTTPVSTLGHSFIMVDFAWHEDPGNQAAGDKVDVQWSTDGLTWNTAATFGRYSAVAGWKLKNVVLPPAADNQDTLYVAFLFTSAHGNDCALDAVQVSGGPPPGPCYVTIGTGTSACAWPYYTYFMGSRTQLLYKSTEILAAGAIAGEWISVGFNVASNSSQVMANFTVRMGMTTANALTAFIPGLATYYQVNYSVPGTGWQDIGLTTPFMWDGSSNVIVEICFGNNGVFTTNSTVYGSSVSGCTWHYHTENYAGCSGSASGTEQTTRPNFRFGFPSTNVGVLKGCVLDLATQQPIAGAIVTVGTQRDTTGDDGRYIFYNLPCGTVTCTTSAPGHVSSTTTAAIACRSITTSNIMMTSGPRLTGTVWNAETGLPITGAAVTIGMGAYAVSAYTVAGGTYLTPPISFQGSQPVIIGKTGYDTFAGNVTLVPGTTTTLHGQLLPTAEAPRSFSAALSGTPDTVATLTWLPPEGTYELLSDDGTQDSFALPPATLVQYAMKFTPATWPTKIMGGKINPGIAADYPTYPAPFAPVTIFACKADGAGGTPGTVLDSVTFSPSGFGWRSFTFSNPVVLNAGDFFLVMQPGGTYPNRAGVGIDTTAASLLCFKRDEGAGNSWIPQPGRYMMRVTLKDTGSPVLQGKSYKVWRLHQGEENNTALWTTVWTGTQTGTTDTAWPVFPSAPYRWAVETRFTIPGQRFSAPTFSNVIGKNYTAGVNVCVTPTCTAEPPAGSLVTLTNIQYPDTTYTQVTDTTGCARFTNVWKGNYNLTVSRFPYATASLALTISDSLTLPVTLQRLKFPPTELGVNNLSLVASWTFPRNIITTLLDDFSSGSFTTNQWTVAGGTNWQISTSTGNPAPSAFFSSNPVVLNYNQYLTSRSVAGLHAANMTLRYDMFLDNFATSTLESMAVEIWDGSSWNVLHTFDNTGGYIPWSTYTENISSLTSCADVKVRFHASGDSSYNIAGWYFDNVAIKNSNQLVYDPCVTGFNIYLDGVLIGTAPDTSFAIPPELVVYGQTYEVCVRTVYSNGLSEPVCTTFTSHYHYPPRNLSASYVPEVVTLTWDPPSNPTGLTGYNIYRFGTLINPSPITALNYSDTVVSFGYLSYQVAAVYGAAESLKAGPAGILTIPNQRVIDSTVVTGDENRCYNAVQTITVAGNGKIFEVQNGGSVTMIAGGNILYYPGTKVDSGGYLWGYIAPSGPFCTNPYNHRPVTLNTGEPAPAGRQPLSFRIYPNPTYDRFLLELTGTATGETCVADLYTIRGESVAHRLLTGALRYTFSLADQPPGIYLLRVISGARSETVKIIKN